jgi:hypothetical protein
MYCPLNFIQKNLFSRAEKLFSRAHKIRNLLNGKIKNRAFDSIIINRKIGFIFKITKGYFDTKFNP